MLDKEGWEMHEHSLLMLGQALSLRLPDVVLRRYLKVLG